MLHNQQHELMQHVDNSAGVGNNTDPTELQTIASKPTSDYAISVNSFNALDKIKELLAFRACKGQGFICRYSAYFSCNRCCYLMQEMCKIIPS